MNSYNALANAGCAKDSGVCAKCSCLVDRIVGRSGFFTFYFIFILLGYLYLSSGNYTMRGLAKLQLVQHKLASIASETLLLIHPEGQMVEPCYLFILLKA